MYLWQSKKDFTSLIILSWESKEETWVPVFIIFSGKNPYVYMSYTYFHICIHACCRFSHGQLFATHWTIACQAPLFMSSPGKNTGVDYHALLQRICTTQGSNPSPASPTLQADSLPLSHQGSPTDHTYPLPKRGKVILKFSWLPHMPGMMVAFPCVILFQAFQQPYELGIIIPIFLSETTKAHSS